MAKLSTDQLIEGFKETVRQTRMHRMSIEPRDN